MPHQVEVARGLLNVNFTMFEATRVPKKWVKLNRRHDRPDGEPLALLDDRGRRVEEYGVRFLNVSDVMPRKNLLGLLRVWIRTTRPTDDAILILKLNCGSDWWLKSFLRSIEKMEAGLGESRKESAPILFMINRLFSDADMPKLYRAATHYWSMSYGEGWDQPMMEAGATGLCLIAPDHTAYTTYLEESMASMIPARRVPAKFSSSDGTHKLFRWADWWKPDEEIATEYIRHAIDNPPDQPNHSVRTRIVQNYTWQHATRRLVEILTDLESASKPTRLHRERLRFLSRRNRVAQDSDHRYEPGYHEETYGFPLSRRGG